MKFLTKIVLVSFIVLLPLHAKSTSTEVFREANSIKNCLACYVLKLDSFNNTPECRRLTNLSSKEFSYNIKYQEGKNLLVLVAMFYLKVLIMI